MTAVAPRGGDRDDPIRSRRARIATAARLGQRLGYGLFLVSFALFLAGIATGFTSLVANLTIASLMVGSIVLAPAIVAGYAARAAEKEDRGRGL